MSEPRVFCRVGDCDREPDSEGFCEGHRPRPCPGCDGTPMFFTCHETGEAICRCANCYRDCGSKGAFLAGYAATRAEAVDEWNVRVSGDDR